MSPSHVAEYQSPAAASALAPSFVAELLLSVTSVIYYTDEVGNIYTDDSGNLYTP